MPVLPSRAMQLPLSGQTSTSSAGTVNQQTTNAGGGNSVLTVNSSVTVPLPYSGSISSGTAYGVLALTLSEALARGLRSNLGALTQSASVQQALGARRVARSNLSIHRAKSSEYITRVTAIGPLGISYVSDTDDPPSGTRQMGLRLTSVRLSDLLWSLLLNALVGSWDGTRPEGAPNLVIDENATYGYRFGVAERIGDLASIQIRPDHTHV